MRIDRGAVGWGVGLVTFGTGLVLRDLGTWPPRLAVWPVALVAAGLALLLVERRRPGPAELAVPLALLIVGGIFTLRGLRLIPGVGLLPILLIAVGVLILVTSTRRRERPGTTSLRVPLDGAGRLRLVANHGAGRLTIRGERMEGLLLDGDFGGGAAHEVRRDGEKVTVELSNPTRPWERPGRWGPWNWTISVNRDVPAEIDLHTGADKTVADLRDLRVETLTVQTGASDTEIIAPGRGRSTIRVEAGAANVVIRVPEGVAAEIRNRTALGGVEIDEFRYPRHGEHHRSAGYEGAEDRVAIELSGGLANFTVR